MTANELKAALGHLGWTAARLARILKLNEKTVQYWKNGRVPVPGYAEAYLNLAIGLHEIQAEIKARGDAG